MKSKIQTWLARIVALLIPVITLAIPVVVWYAVVYKLPLRIQYIFFIVNFTLNCVVWGMKPFIKNCVLSLWILKKWG